jgi:NAD(P)-dependent dehydrogenase (short-subunit alcohol dehydrogenase family)
VTDARSVGGLAEAASSRGPLGVLIHGAGVSPALAGADRILAVNLLGTVAILDAFLPLAGRGTVAVCVASIAGQRGSLAAHDEALADPRRVDFAPMLAERTAFDEKPALAYGLSKRGVMLLVEHDAHAWGERGARLVSISPGHIVDTPMGRLEADNGAAPLAAASALGRSALAEEIAGACALLASADAGHITGCDLRVDGGVVAGLRWHSAPETQAHWDSPRD